MASSGKRPSASGGLKERRTVVPAKAGAHALAVGLSGGIDSVVLLHQLRHLPGVSAVHVHHALSRNADAWAEFARQLCKRWRVPFTVYRVTVEKRGEGLEAAARAARYEVFRRIPADVVVLAHNLDDQAETVLMNLLRGAGTRGASGMRPQSSFHGKTLLRPLLDVPRAAIAAYARSRRLEWIEDESNADEALTRNFIRRRVGPLLEKKFPGWRQNLARAARHFARTEAGAEELLRGFLRAKGLRAPSEAKLVEMLKQLTSRGSRTLIEHDGARLRVYRGRIIPERPVGAFAPMRWQGEEKLAIPELGGELRFRRARGRGIALEHRPLSVRLRAGGEHLQPDPRRPRRKLKNLFQEAGVPPWERERLPLLFCGEELVWAPGLGIDARFQAAAGKSGLLPRWQVTRARK